MSRRIDVADRALDQAGFLVDQRRRDRLQGVLADVVPQPQQIFAVALDLGLGPLGAGGAHDQAHAVRDVEFRHDLLQPAAVGGRGDLARDAAAARRVRHQHAVTAGERQIGGQRRALVAALLLDHLHQHDLAAADDFLDLVVAQEARRQPAFALLVAVVLIAAASVSGGGSSAICVIVGVVRVGVVRLVVLGALTSPSPGSTSSLVGSSGEASIGGNSG